MSGLRLRQPIFVCSSLCWPDLASAICCSMESTEYCGQYHVAPAPKRVKRLRDLSQVDLSAHTAFTNAMFSVRHSLCRDYSSMAFLAYHECHLWYH